MAGCRHPAVLELEGSLTLRRDEAIRSRILELSRSGNEVPEDLVSEASAGRRGLFDDLLALGPPKAEEALGGDVRAAEDAVEALEEGSAGRPEEQIPRALELGEQVRWLLWLAEAVSGETAVDPLSFVEEELDRVERSARDLSRWDRSLAGAAGGVLKRVHEVRARLASRRSARFQRRARGGESREPLERALAEWAGVSESFQIELELLRTSGRGLPDTSLEKDLEPLRALRASRCKEAASWLCRCTPVELGLFIRRQATELADDSSVVLSEGAAARPLERIPAIRLLAERIEILLEVTADARDQVARKAPLPPEAERNIEKDLRSLRRILRKCSGARTEAEAGYRLERLLGPRWTRYFENLVLVLVVAFLGLVVVEWRLPSDSPHLLTVYTADLLLCLFFQADFVLRWALARWSGRYFLRHFFFESLPALPYGFIFHHLSHARDLGALEELRALIVVRLLRLRGVFLLVVRVLRVVFFLVRGTDRAVERLRGALDRDVVLFDPHSIGEESSSDIRRRLLVLESRRQKAFRGMYADIPWPARAPILEAHARLLDTESRLASATELPYGQARARAAGEIRLEELIRGFLDCDEPTAVALLGHEGTRRVARSLRLLDVPLIRHFPLVGRLVPAARAKDAAEASAMAVQAVGQALQNFLGAVRFWGDLSGITTGPQVLDRVATTLIKAASRPAMRLLYFGGLFVLFKGLAQLLGVVFLERASTSLLRFLGLPLLILGSICMVFLLTGRWFKRIAGEALDVYLRTADAHFYSLLKTWKLDRWKAEVLSLFRSVLLPELKLREGCEASEEEWLEFLSAPIFPARDEAREGGAPAEERFASWREHREVVMLLYRDYLDGPILQRLDDKSSVQLLGNLAVQEIRVQTLRMTKKEIRRLEWLDLEKDRLLTLGPYFWFRFITESLAIETAKLILEYNTNVLPRDQAALAPPEKVERQARFLARRAGRDAGRLDATAGTQHVGEPLYTYQFTALHFLTADRRRDEDVRLRFGDEVLDALRRDRKAMVRDIFGTHPYHLLPRAKRVLNPYRLYHKYLAGARFLLFPLAVLFSAARLVFTLTCRVVGMVQEVMGKKAAPRGRLPREAGFDVAARKIHRMRKPFFMEALRLRCALDLEYLGLRLPGFERSTEIPTFRDDLDFIGALDGERRPFEKLRSAALTDLRRFRNFLAGRGWLTEEFLSVLDPSGRLAERRGEVIRALATAYITDHGSLRSFLTAPEAAREFFEAATLRKETLRVRMLGCLAAGLRRMLPSGKRRAALFAEWLERSGEFRELSPRTRRKALRAFLAAEREKERTFCLAVERAKGESSGIDAVLGELRRVAFDCKAWTRKIIVLRALQTITVLDIRGYRDLIHAVGEYGLD